MLIDITQVKLFIEANLKIVRKTLQVAEHMNCSVEKLKKSFFKSEKQSLSRYIRESKVSKMKERLLASFVPCKVICLDLGLREDVGARLFKNATGMTMEEFRRLYRRETPDAWKADAQRQLASKRGPRLVLTEGVIKQVLSAEQSGLPPQPARRHNGALTRGPGN